MTEQYKSDKEYIDHLAYVGLSIIKENGGKMLLSDLREEVKKRDEIPDRLMQRNNMGRIKWEHGFASTAQTFVAAGYLIKGGRVDGWQITREGEQALVSLSEMEVIINAKKAYSRKADYIYHLAYVALLVLNANEGKMLLSDLREAIEKQEGENISPDLRETNASGGVKWDVRMRAVARRLFAAAGYLRMLKGIWHLTPKGEDALQSGDEEAVIKSAKESIQQVRMQEETAHLSDTTGGDIDATQQVDVEITDDDAAQQIEVDGDDVAGDASISLDDHENTAKTAIKEYIYNMDEYKFQDLCAALLRGMGYYTPDIALRGADGGVDIVAYADPLGGKSPRIKVQVKRYKDKNHIPVGELDKLFGKIRDGEIGVFITSSAFTRECKRTARDHPVHIELIDFDRLLELWIAHYDKLSDEDKQLLPLRPIYFLAKD